MMEATMTTHPIPSVSAYRSRALEAEKRRWIDIFAQHAEAFEREEDPADKAVADVAAAFIQKLDAQLGLLDAAYPSDTADWREQDVPLMWIDRPGLVVFLAAVVGALCWAALAVRWFGG